MKTDLSKLSPSRALQLMFAGLMPGRGSNDIELVAAAFIMSIDGISDLAIVETAVAFMKGEVEGHKNGFVPNSAEFASAARRCESLGMAMANQLINNPHQLAKLKVDQPALHDKAKRWMECHRQKAAKSLAGATPKVAAE